MVLAKKLLRTAWYYKSQFISMILMITIGIGIFAGLNIEWKSLEYNMNSFFEETAYADFRLYSEKGFTKENIDSIKNINGVDGATRYLSVVTSIKDTDKTVTLNVSEDFNVSTMLVTSGKEYQKNSDGIWLSDRFAEKNNYSIGDKMTLEYQGATISGEIVGLIKSGENAICVADETQLMPDFNTHGFVYISPKMLEDNLGFAFYPQINIISNMDKKDLETQVKNAVGQTIQIVKKDLHISYSGATGEIDEGKTMGSLLPVLFLAIAILTMVTTMHRISANEKVQIGTLKALGFRDKRILLHYTSFGLFIGIVGSILGTLLGYIIGWYIINPNGTMATYVDLPQWKLKMPAFCVPVIILTILLLTLISFLSVKKMLKGTASEALRPYTPKAMRQLKIEKFKFWKKLKFDTKWNLRDILRHKSRSAMTLIGIIGCMVLILAGLGMRDTMDRFLLTLDETVCNYKTKINISETAQKEDILTLCDSLNGDWQSSTGISYNANTITLDIYHNENGLIQVIDKDNKAIEISDDGVYLCQRLKDTAEIGDTVTISPYGSDKTFDVKVSGYVRSISSECIVMSDTLADKIGFEYSISSIYTNKKPSEISNSDIISGVSDKDKIISSYNSYISMMNLMIVILVIAAIILGIVVLYNLGIMSYVERKRELATLKVLGFRDRTVGKLLISQNIWLTVLGIIIGIPSSYGTLYYVFKKLASEYELKTTIGFFSILIGCVITFGVSLLVGLMVAKRNKKINMVEALKDAE